ncbi:MAG: DUF1801 domain-containing protein [Thaumarchaeota archaeon]|nr:DUF1801 domain-containing protein [Nitrososphaerota archaeon]
MMDAKVKRWLDDLSESKKELAMKVREIVFKAEPSIKEAIKWGSLTFISDENIAWIINYPQKEYTNFGFFRATELSDPKRLLEGSGKGLRHVKIKSEKDIDAKQFTAWIKEAVKLNKEKPKK